MNENQNRPIRTHVGPHPGMVAIVFVLLFVSSMVANGMLTGGAPFPNPYSPIARLAEYYRKFHDASRVTSTLLSASIIPLVVYVATVFSRLLFHGIRVAGVYIAFCGGITAAVFLGISAMSSWVLSQPDVAASPGALRVVQLLGFSAGGFAHTAFLGLLLAGVSVPCLFNRLMPRWVCWLGLAIAGVAELSTFGMIFRSATIILPFARFPGYIWLIIAGFRLRNTRRSPVNQS